MYPLFLVAILLSLFNGCSRPNDGGQRLKALAEKYFRGVYGCDSSVVDNLAADDIAISYPILQKLFNTPTIRGRVAAKHFASRFCSKWTNAKIAFHEVIAESDKVVLIWSFQAINIGPTQPGVPPSGKEESWGGITFVRFNKAGRIEAEIGEESEPGPIERVSEGL